MKLKPTLVMLALASSALVQAQTLTAECRAPNPSAKPSLTAAEAELSLMQAQFKTMVTEQAQRVSASRSREESAQKAVQVQATAYTSKLAVARYWEDVSRMSTKAPSTEVASVRARHVAALDKALVEVNTYGYNVRNLVAQDTSRLQRELTDLKTVYARLQSTAAQADGEIQELRRQAVTAEATALGSYASEEVVSSVQVAEKMRAALASRAHLSAEVAVALARVTEAEARLEAIVRDRDAALASLATATARANAATTELKAQAVVMSAAAKRLADSRTAEASARTALYKSLDNAGKATLELQAAVKDLAAKRKYAEDALAQMEQRVDALRQLVNGTC